MRKLFFMLFAVLALAPLAVQAQYHWDGGPPMDSTQWADIIGDHNNDDGHCDNTSSSGQGFPDVDCGHWNDAPGAPIQSADQDCGSGYCTVSTTARCRWLYPDNGNLITFSCTGSATEGVVAGYLGNGKKGVRCGAKECGCVTVCPPGGYTNPGPGVSWAACANQFFGNQSIRYGYYDRVCN